MSELVEWIAELEREVAEARERIAALEVERRLPRIVERPARVPEPFTERTLAGEPIADLIEQIQTERREAL